MVLGFYSWKIGVTLKANIWQRILISWHPRLGLFVYINGVLKSSTNEFQNIPKERSSKEMRIGGKMVKFEL